MGRLSNHCLRQAATVEAAIRNISREQRQAYGQEYFQRLRRMNRDATLIIDTMPDNFQSLWLIAQLFLNAKVIHLQRNPLDTRVACYTTHFPTGHPYTSDLTELGMYYADYRKLMDHWNEVLPLEILAIDYEALVAHQEAESRRSVEFLGLSWQDECLECAQHPRVKWKRYEAHLGPLMQELQIFCAVSHNQD